MDLQLRAADGGYILKDTQERVFTSLEDVFRYLLLRFEGRSNTFLGDSYGAVQIFRQPLDRQELRQRGDSEVAAAARRYVTTYETTHDGEERMAVGDALWRAVKHYIND